MVWEDASVKHDTMRRLAQLEGLLLTGQLFLYIGVGSWLVPMDTYWTQSHVGAKRGL